MARPKKNNADYFSHDKEMRNDPKIKALRTKFGITGYAVWCMFIETLCDCENLEYVDGDVERTLTAGDFGVSDTEINDFFDFCVRIKLLKSENGKIYSESLKNRLKSVFEKRDDARKKYSKNKVSASEKNRNTQNNDVSESETTQSGEFLHAENTQSKEKVKIKEKKEKNKEKESTSLSSHKKNGNDIENDYSEIFEKFNETFDREGYLISKDNWHASDVIKKRILESGKDKILIAIEQAKKDYFNDSKMYKMCQWAMFFRDTTIEKLYNDSLLGPPQNQKFTGNDVFEMPKEFM